MQTFLPYADYKKSAQSLDRFRLGKQRVEGLQILNSLVEGGGWSDHPAVKMWRSHEGALAQYTIAICEEWQSRGYRDTVKGKVLSLLKDHPEWNSLPPRWMGDPAFHLSHQSNLVRKKPEFYARKFPGISGDMAYIWPKGE